MSLQTSVWVCAAVLFSSGGGGQRLEKPPEVYVDRGGCPGECCTYGTWRAERAVILHEAARERSKIIGRVDAGSEVLAETGEVHTRAGKFVVRRESPPYRVGDTIWLYTYVGEGFYKVWRAGEMVEQEISVMPDQTSPNDWGYYARAPHSVWWIRVKVKGGAVGWTNAPDNFSGTHSCG